MRVSKIRPSLELRSCSYTDTGSEIPTTLSDAWTNLGNIRFLRHGGRLRRPTSGMASPTQESLQTPRPTPEYTEISPVSLKPTASKTLRPNGKSQPPLALSTSSWPQRLSPPTPKPARSPTWSHWASNSTSVRVNTRIRID